MRRTLAPVLAVVSLAGCTWTGGSDAPPSAAVVIGGSAQQRALMEHILHGLGASSIERVWIGNEPHQGRAGVPPGPHWLALRIRAHTGLNDTRDLPGRAQAMIAADLFARSSAASCLPAINGASLHLHDADGRRLYATSWHTSPQRSRLFGWSLLGRSLRAAITRAVLANGFRVGSIRLMGAPVEAAEIVVTASSPHGMRRHLDRVETALRPLQRPAHPRGMWSSLTYLQVNGCGQPVAAVGVGGAWADQRWLCPNPWTLAGKADATCPPPARGC
jgi:hypothetical protein